MTAENVTEKKVVWILGLNHSGTTIVWSAFRKDTKFLCFDEPMTFDVAAWFPRNNAKKTFDEYQRVFGNDPAIFWSLFASIDPMQELDREFSAEQRRYLEALIAQADNVVIDETHLHLHCGSLRGIYASCNVIHLYRRAKSFATSHLRPNWSRHGSASRQIVRWLRYQYDKGSFWSRVDYPPGMRRGDVIGTHPQSKFGLLLAEAGYDAKRIMNSSALVRLLAYWHYHYHYMEREGRKEFGDRFKSLRYEDFALMPRETMHDIYGWLGVAAPITMDYSNVHPPRPPFCMNDRRWVEAANVAGFAQHEIETLL